MATIKENAKEYTVLIATVFNSKGKVSKETKNFSMNDDVVAEIDNYAIDHGLIKGSKNDTYKIAGQLRNAQNGSAGKV